jgi:hypothetical protein
MPGRPSSLAAAAPVVCHVFEAGCEVLFCVCRVAGWAVCTPVYLCEAGAAVTVQ